MPKRAKELTAVEVRRLIQPGRHAVGTVSGLCLNVKPTGARSWILRKMFGNDRIERGLGAYPETTLAQAIDRAREYIDSYRAGVDPAAERQAERAAAEHTFQRCAEKYIELHRAGWKNVKHAQQWENTLATYCFPKFGAKHVRDVTKADVLAAIESDWTTKNETMVRVRNRIELVLAWAMQRDLRPAGVNPAAWKGNLDAALPKPSKVNQREHFEAVPIDDVHDFIVKLRSVEGMSARALEFAALTVSRTGAVRLAHWSEIDIPGKVWNVPGAHMKSGRPHRVPLSDVAVQLVEALPRFEGVEFVFPGRGNKPLSDMALTAVMRRMGLSAVPHGLRSTFADWCAERTATPPEVREMALAHAIGDRTEEAYRRGDLFDKRRTVMQQWAAFIDTAPPAGNVRVLRKGA